MGAQNKTRLLRIAHHGRPCLSSGDRCFADLHGKYSSGAAVYTRGLTRCPIAADTPGTQPEFNCDFVAKVLQSLVAAAYVEGGKEWSKVTRIASLFDCAGQPPQRACSACLLLRRRAYRRRSGAVGELTKWAKGEVDQVSQNARRSSLKGWCADTTTVENEKLTGTTQI